MTDETSTMLSSIELLHPIGSAYVHVVLYPHRVEKEDTLHAGLLTVVVHPQNQELAAYTNNDPEWVLGQLYELIETMFDQYPDLDREDVLVTIVGPYT